MARSRGKRRNRRRSAQADAARRLPKGKDGESAASRSYTEGRSFGYGYRIKGPVGKVTVTRIEDDTD